MKTHLERIIEEYGDALPVTGTVAVIAREGIERLLARQEIFREARGHAMVYTREGWRSAP